jgi:exonuclease SbcD
MTRLVHLSDTHLGFRQLHKATETGRNQREQDTYDVFAEAVDQIVELHPDLVVHAGDLFDSYLPSSAALNAALSGFAELRDAGIPVVVIAGNHSTPRLASADHIFAVLEKFGGVSFVYGRPQTIIVGDLAVAAVPHLGDAKELEQALAAARPSPDSKFNVLVTHVGLERMTQITGPESASVVLSGDALTTAEEFDYIALGHLHQFAPVRENAAYSGSLERFSWADRPEVSEAKGFLEVDLSLTPMDNGFVRFHEVSPRPRITLGPIDASNDGDLAAAIRARAENAGEELAGALVQLEVNNVSAPTWSALNWRDVAAIFAPALHVELIPRMVGGAELSSPQPELSEFLRSWAVAKAQGLDVDQMIARAEALLARADRELA